MMKRKFFFKNLTFFLILLLIPMLLLGTFSILVTQRFIKDNIEKSNINLLMQSKENIELILNEVDSLSLNFDKDPVIVKRLKELLSSDSITYEGLDSLDYIKNYVDVPANSKSYIHSIYVYYESGSSKFISSSQVLSDLRTYTDKAWYDSYQKKKELPSEDLWFEAREVKLYEFDKKPTSITSIYKKLYTPGSNSCTGVVVLNIHTPYVDNLLKSIATVSNQSIIVTDSSNNILFKNYKYPYIDNIDLSNLANNPGKFLNIKIEDTYYTATVIHSERYKWNYISIAPQKSLYKLTFTLRLATFLLLILLLLIGIILSFIFAKNNYKQIQRVLSVIEAAENDSPLPDLPSKVTDEYGFIVQNIIKTFIEQSYLKVQLSERKYKMQVMELEALQSQINPHFLYNTLHTIYWETLNLTGKPNKANQMISHLTDILDYALSNPRQCVTILEEIKYTRNYVEIQKIRYNDKFDVIWEYDQDLRNEKILKLILQPLIENSIYHGIKEKQGLGLIKIKIQRDNLLLKITVIDNGLGIKKQDLDAINEKLEVEGDYSRHIGLFNTNKRLQLRYGEEFGIKINSKIGLGTAIYIRIPLET